MDLTRRFTRGYSHRPDKAYQPLNKAFAMTRASVNPACGNNFILQRRDCLQLGTRGGSSNQDWRDKGRNLGIVAFFNRILRNRVAFAKKRRKKEERRGRKGKLDDLATEPGAVAASASLNGLLHFQRSIRRARWTETFRRFIARRINRRSLKAGNVHAATTFDFTAPRRATC